jgi:hypothetical protein
MRVSSSVGTPVRVTELGKDGEVMNRFGQTLVTGGYFGRYMPASDGTGHLLYIQEGSIFAAPMNLKKLELTGPASPVLEDVSIRRNNGFPQLDFTPTGTVVYVAGLGSRDTRSLAFVDSSDNVQALPVAPADHLNVRLCLANSNLTEPRWFRGC